MTLFETLGLAFPAVVSVVGGGGKTSFIFTLAREAAARGGSVLVTTTTAMFNPECFTPGTAVSDGRFDRLFTGPAAELPGPVPGHVLVAAPALVAEGKKLTGYSPEDLAPVLDRRDIDLVLIEADGARMRPIKAPADHEPVVPTQTTLLAGCIGLDCLDHPLDERIAHRPELLAALAGLTPGDPITDQTLLRLAASNNGLFKSRGELMDTALVLNKADTDALADRGEAIGRQAVSAGSAHTCIVTSLATPESPVKRRILKE